MIQPLRQYSDTYAWGRVFRPFRNEPAAPSGSSAHDAKSSAATSTRFRSCDLGIKLVAPRPYDPNRPFRWLGHTTATRIRENSAPLAPGHRVSSQFALCRQLRSIVVVGRLHQCAAEVTMASVGICDQWCSRNFSPVLWTVAVFPLPVGRARYATNVGKNYPMNSC